MTDIKEVLEGAKALIQDKGWTRASNARNLAGDSVFYRSPEACCYYLRGAIAAATVSEPNTTVYNLTRIYLENLEDLKVGKVKAMSIVMWNDTIARGVDDVIKLLDYATEQLSNYKGHVR